MNGLQGRDILILALVFAVSILIIYLRSLARKRAAASGKSCSGCCSSCGMACRRDTVHKDTDKE